MSDDAVTSEDEWKSFLPKDGSLFAAEVAMSGGRLDGLRLVVLAIHDITSRKQAEEALQQSEERFHQIVDNMSSGVVVYEAARDGEDFMIEGI